MIAGHRPDGGLPRPHAGRDHCLAGHRPASTCSSAAGLVWFGSVSSEQNDRRERLVDRAAARPTSKLDASLAENAGLHAQLLAQAREAGVLDERQRMAREIHDTLAQGLTGIITQLQAAEQAGEDPRGSGAGTSTPRSGWRRESLSEARRSVHALRPEPLELARLGEALAEVARALVGPHGVAAQVTTTGTARPMRAGDRSGAAARPRRRRWPTWPSTRAPRRVGLTLSYMDDEVALDVRDDGGGFRARAGARGTGTVRPGSGWPRCGSGSRARPGRCRSSPSRAAAPRSRPACLPGPRRQTRLRPAGADRGMSRHAPDGAPIRLLIADDHPVVRDGLSGMFGRRPRFEVRRRGRRRRRGGPARPGRCGPT